MTRVVVVGAGFGGLAVARRLAGAPVDVTIVDNGPGISPDEQGQVFSRFHRVGGNARGDAAFGLGLPLTQQFVEAHGGKVELESSLGKGTTVKLKIPRAPQ